MTGTLLNLLALWLTPWCLFTWNGKETMKDLFDSLNQAEINYLDKFLIDLSGIRFLGHFFCFYVTGICFLGDFFSISFGPFKWLDTFFRLVNKFIDYIYCIICRIQAPCCPSTLCAGVNFQGGRMYFLTPCVLTTSRYPGSEASQLQTLSVF